tara:strand:- start:6813 stop:7079 length:267 start_codon:yes stop_codon:yes gene_type:complete
LIQFLLDFQGIANQLPDNIMAAEGWYNRIVRPPNAFPDAIDGLAPATACRKEIECPSFQNNRSGAHRPCETGFQKALMPLNSVDGRYP